MDLERIRADFPITQEPEIYLDNASVAPIPTPVVEAATNFFHKHSRLGFQAYWEGITEIASDTRCLCAQLIGAEPEEIALVENTGTGMNIVANLLPWKPGDNVVLTDLEYFPYQWSRLRRLGVDLKIVPSLKPDGSRDITPADLEAAINERTRAIVISQFSFLNGHRHDLKAVSSLAKSCGAYLVLDAIQSVGAARLNVKEAGIDFLACGGYKWLLGPIGTGFFYCRKELLEQFEPAYVGWHSDRNQFDNGFRAEYKLSSSAERFMPGGMNFAGFAGLRAGIRYLLEIGMEQIEKRNLALAERAVSGLLAFGIRLLSPLRPEARSHIITFVPASCQFTLEALDRAGIHLVQRAEGIRFAPNFYNAEWEIDRLLDVVCAAENSAYQTIL